MLACKHDYFYPPAMHTEQYPDPDTCACLGHVTVQTAHNLATQPPALYPAKIMTRPIKTNLSLVLARISHNTLKICCTFSMQLSYMHKL